MEIDYFPLIWAASTAFSLIIGAVAVGWAIRAGRKADQERVRSLPLRIAPPPARDLHPPTRRDIRA